MSGMASGCVNLPTRRSPRYKDALVPRRFFHQLSQSLPCFSSPLRHTRAPCALDSGELHFLLFDHPVKDRGAIERYHGLLFARSRGSTVSSNCYTVGLPSPIAPADDGSPSSAGR
jgi:hypothetical protein